MPRAPKVLKEFSKDPEKTLVIIDPRKSETASIANIHIPVRPGTDALLIKAMISSILSPALNEAAVSATSFPKETSVGQSSWPTPRLL